MRTNKFRLNPNILLAVLSTIVALLISEGMLRFLGVNASDMEKKKTGTYHSQFGNWGQKLFELRPANTIIVEKKEEFTHIIHTNSLGLNDYEWKLKSDSANRIACMGDSYTEGFGAVGDSSYPKILQTLLPSTEVMRCGLQGCDPLYEYELLKEKILQYHPNTVTLTINSTDIDDVITKGGFERFGADGIIRGREEPWWEIFYARSYIIRLIARNGLKMDYLLMTHRQHQKEFEKATRIIETCLDKFQDLCSSNRIRCIFLFNPGAHEVKRTNMDCELILKYAANKGYETIDGLAYFKKQGVADKNWSQYYWEKDGHNNNSGYRLIALSLAEYFSSTATQDSSLRH